MWGENQNPNYPPGAGSRWVQAQYVGADQLLFFAFRYNHAADYTFREAKISVNFGSCC